MRPDTCGAMVLEAPRTPLVWRERPVAAPAPGQVLIEVSACGVCRTDLHLLDAELPDIRYPIVPGHQVVGRVVAKAADVAGLRIHQRVGVAWLASTCGECGFCVHGQENLCDHARFTGYQVDGGYATHCVADARYIYALPDDYGDLDVAPLLCAGLIGYRALRMCGDARRIGIYGFGSAAHVIAQVAAWEGREILAFTRTGDVAAQEFALSLGASWAGGAGETAPQPLDAAIIFASAGELVPAALRALRKGGTVVCGGIHMSDIPSFHYADLWGERVLRSVANLTRQDAIDFLAIAPKIPVRTHISRYPLQDANRALADLRGGRLVGSAVLDIARHAVDGRESARRIDVDQGHSDAPGAA